MTNPALQAARDADNFAEGTLAGSRDVVAAINSAIMAVRRYRGDRGLLPGLYEALRVAQAEQLDHMKGATLAAARHTSAMIADMSVTATTVTSLQ